MKTTTSLILIILLLLLSSIYCIAQLISEEQAMNAIRSFEINNTLQFGNMYLHDDTSDSDWSDRWWYSIQHSDYSNTGWSWDVDAVTGEVNYAYYGNRIADTPVDDPFGPSTQAQCRAIAENFAMYHYDDFSNMGFQLTDQSWSGEGWHFIWSQIVDYGASTPNGVDVAVNPLDGSIQFYFSSRFASSSPRQPQLSAQDAIDTAMQVGGIETLQWNDPPNLFTTPDGDVSWNFALGGLGSESEYIGFLISIDAETGALLEKSPESYMNEINYNTLYPIEKLLSHIRHTSFCWTSKDKAKLTIGEKVFILTLGSDIAVFKDVAIPIGRRIELEKGKLMAPGDLLKALLISSEKPAYGITNILSLPTPTFDCNQDKSSDSKKIIISCAVKGVETRYTTDGSEPTESSALYTGPVAITQSCTFKAKAFKSGWTSSNIKSAEYTIEQR